MTSTMTRSSASTRTLLTAAAAAMPVWTVVALAQAFTREGFDLVRHPFSQFATGSLGWIQITNFLIVGSLLVAGSFGFRGALYGEPGGTWVPRLTLAAGIGMIGAGVFVMDPADGFPVGTPAGPPAAMSWHSIMHMVTGAVTFIALAAACFVLGRYFTRTGARGTAVASRLAGVALIVGDGWAITGGHAGSVTLATGVMIAMAWVSLVAARFRKSA
ncbi:MULTISPECIES: DUF998 domain-containing protein [Streptosporangium]|uniref:DUF998 domain-containing protein n=1 Tax=Streptosporangium brasiliense TaxID=47480 RepID=A0ABT9R7S2_9ACTN|nr:DUF998 domain-containing protein [Streptosporangium brasiliense]MDP9864859.1 hypothetical protein [Streptosporangium brasiliense]